MSIMKAYMTTGKEISDMKGSFEGSLYVAY